MNYISGRFVSPEGVDWLPVMNPARGVQIGSVPLSAACDIDAAVSSARAALPDWSGTPVKERAQILYQYRRLLSENTGELAQLVQEENGKTRGEALAEIEKSIEVTEFACSMPQIAVGEILEVSRGVECRLER